MSNNGKRNNQDCSVYSYRNVCNLKMYFMQHTVHTRVSICNPQPRQVFTCVLPVVNQTFSHGILNTKKRVSVLLPLYIFTY